MSNVVKLFLLLKRVQKFSSFFNFFSQTRKLTSKVVWMTKFLHSYHCFDLFTLSRLVKLHLSFPFLLLSSLFLKKLLIILKRGIIMYLFLLSRVIWSLFIFLKIWLFLLFKSFVFPFFYFCLTANDKFNGIMPNTHRKNEHRKLEISLLRSTFFFRFQKFLSLCFLFFLSF